MAGHRLALRCHLCFGLRERVKRSLIGPLHSSGQALTLGVTREQSPHESSFLIREEFAPERQPEFADQPDDLRSWLTDGEDSRARSALSR
jgi:hypothetical protein